MPANRIPLWLKLAFTLWVGVWIPVYWTHNGPANFLWFCDIANFVLLVALWLESPLLLSSQAVGVLLIQLLWALDFLTALAVRVHPVGGTEYMFDAAEPLWLRGFSLFHLAMPPLLLWGVARLGYHRRGWLLQTAVAWVVMPVCFFFTAPERNLNWVWEPFGQPQTLLAPGTYLAACLLAYPLVLLLPSHLALRAWARRSPRVPLLPAGADSGGAASFSSEMST